MKVLQIWNAEFGMKTKQNTDRISDCNIGSLEICASAYISAKLQKNVPIQTNRFSFQLKLTLEAVKLCQLLLLFTQSMILKVHSFTAYFTHYYLRNIIIQNNFKMLRDLKTDTFEGVVTYPASYA